MLYGKIPPPGASPQIPTSSPQKGDRGLHLVFSPLCLWQELVWHPHAHLSPASTAPCHFSETPAWGACRPRPSPLRTTRREARSPRPQQPGPELPHTAAPSQRGVVGDHWPSLGTSGRKLSEARAAIRTGADGFTGRKLTVQLQTRLTQASHRLLPCHTPARACPPPPPLPERETQDETPFAHRCRACQG